MNFINQWLEYLTGNEPPATPPPTTWQEMLLPTL